MKQLLSFSPITKCQSLSKQVKYSIRIEQQMIFASHFAIHHKLQMHSKPSKLVRDYGSTKYVSLSSIVSTVNFPLISCTVCGSEINIFDTNDQSVFQCPKCHEGIPIRPAPAGKKYVRCPCNCLIICRESALKIVCPRSSCKRTTHLVTLKAHNAIPSSIFTCAYCSNPFRTDRPADPAGVLVRCPHFHCKNMTSIGGPKLASKWAIVFLILSTMFIALAAGVAYGAIYVEQTSKGVMYAGYIGLFLVAMILLVRSIFYWTMKVSEKQGSA